MNGEIVEEGSHNQLIRERGKYHDLWSKQVFLDPQDCQSKLGSQGQGDDNLTNDISLDENIIPASSKEWDEEIQKGKCEVLTSGQKPKGGESQRRHVREVRDKPE